MLSPRIPSKRSIFPSNLEPLWLLLNETVNRWDIFRNRIVVGINRAHMPNKRRGKLNVWATITPRVDAWSKGGDTI